MNNTAYVALSRQSALQKELTSVANNIANSDTTGFRRETQIFSEFVQRLGIDQPSLSQTNAAGRFIDFRPGALEETGGSLDVALENEGFFVVDTPNGRRLTRAGSFVSNPEGILTNVSGFPVLSDGGAPISVPRDADTINVTQDGTILADNAPIGKILVVQVDATNLAREGGNLFRADAELAPAEAPRIRQGFLEKSNVNPVLEISRLIEVQRAYELNQQILRDEDDRISRTIEATGTGR